VTGPPTATAARRAARRVTCCLVVAVLACLGVAGPAGAEREPPASPLISEAPEGWPEPPDVSAEAWVLVDAATGQILAERRGEQRRPVASTVKVLTALTVLDRVDVDDVVRVGEEVEVGGASVGLSPGDEWTVEQLLDGLLIRSGNDAAEALAVHVAGDMESFVELMAADAAALGLQDVVITEASGLGDGNELSARDLAVLSRVALSDPDLRELLGRETADLPGAGRVVNRNELLRDYPGATGVKTGYTEAAGFGLIGSAERDDVELVAVVLGSEEDPARFADATRLLDHGFEAYEPVTLGATWELVVAGGQHSLVAEEVTVVVPEPDDVTFGGLPPARPLIGLQAVELLADEAVLGTIDVEVDDGPAPVSGTAALGRVLVDEAYAGMRATTAADRW
jgi:serine-type D-Ala-D-Ala carboxypeptidase (penicillin-binding protein 5/6)